MSTSLASGGNYLSPWMYNWERNIQHLVKPLRWLCKKGLRFSIRRDPSLNWNSHSQVDNTHILIINKELAWWSGGKDWAPNAGGWCLTLCQESRSRDAAPGPVIHSQINKHLNIKFFINKLGLREVRLTWLCLQLVMERTKNQMQLNWLQSLIYLLIVFNYCLLACVHGQRSLAGGSP